MTLMILRMLTMLRVRNFHCFFPIITYLQYPFIIKGSHKRSRYNQPTPPHQVVKLNYVILSFVMSYNRFHLFFCFFPCNDHDKEYHIYRKLGLYRGEGHGTIFRALYLWNQTPRWPQTSLSPQVMLHTREKQNQSFLYALISFCRIS